MLPKTGTNIITKFDFCNYLGLLQNENGKREENTFDG